MDECDLRLDNDGNYRTLYSLRHTYATMRINEVPIYQLAVNMGTSVKMIEEYYSHAQTKDPKFAKLLNENPTRRLGKSDDIGAMVVYLCSKNGGFVNGQMLQINGGVVTQF